MNLPINRGRLSYRGQTYLTCLRHKSIQREDRGGFGGGRVGGGFGGRGGDRGGRGDKGGIEVAEEDSEAGADSVQCILNIVGFEYKGF